MGLSASRDPPAGRALGRTPQPAARPWLRSADHSGPPPASHFAAAENSDNSERVAGHARCLQLHTSARRDIAHGTQNNLTLAPGLTRREAGAQSHRSPRAVRRPRETAGLPADRRRATAVIRPAIRTGIRRIHVALRRPDKSSNHVGEGQALCKIPSSSGRRACVRSPSARSRCSS